MPWRNNGRILDDTQFRSARSLFSSVMGESRQALPPPASFCKRDQ